MVLAQDHNTSSVIQKIDNFSCYTYFDISLLCWHWNCICFYNEWIILDFHIPLLFRLGRLFYYLSLASNGFLVHAQCTVITFMSDISSIRCGIDRSINGRYLLSFFCSLCKYTFSYTSLFFKSYQYLFFRTTLKFTFKQDIKT